LSKNASLINNATIYIYGYLKEKNNDNGSKFDNKNESNIYVPFVVRDFKGGKFVVSCYNTREKIGSFPFNQYEVRNISVEAYYRYGSTLTGMADLYANGSHNTTKMDMISSSSSASSAFIQLTNSGGYVRAKFTESSSYMDTPTGKGSCVLDIYGGCTFNSMTLSLKMSFLTAEVSSSDFYLPISWRFKVGLYKLDSQTSASYTASDKYQFLPGSSLTVGAGVSLNAGTLVFYKEWPSSVTETYAYTRNLIGTANKSLESSKNSIADAWKRYYYTSSERRSASYLLNNGSVITSTFSGLIRSNVTGATMKINSSCSSSNYQPLSSSSSSTADIVKILAGADMNIYMKIDNTATYSDESTAISSTGTYTSSLVSGSYGFFPS